MRYSEPQILKSHTLPLTQPVQPADNQSVEVQELPGFSEVHRPNMKIILYKSYYIIIQIAYKVEIKCNNCINLISLECLSN